MGFQANERVAERMMDNTDLERERGITILAKNTAVHYRDILINIVDTLATPISAARSSGHWPWSMACCCGRVRRTSAADAVRPSQAPERRLTPLVVINKIDRPDARPQEGSTKS